MIPTDGFPASPYRLLLIFGKVYKNQSSAGGTKSFIPTGAKQVNVCRCVIACVPLLATDVAHGDRY
jgi:hypothetical protein